MRYHRFTLIEICLAIAIFSMGVLTAMSILSPAVRWGAQARTDFAAASAALSAVAWFNGRGWGDSCVFDGTADESVNGNDVGRTYYPYAIEIKINKKPSANMPKIYRDAVITVYRKRAADPFGDNPDGFMTVNAGNLKSSVLVDSKGEPIEFFKIRMNLWQQ